MSSQCGSQKLLQGLVPHKLTAYFSVFNLFLTELWPYYQKDVNQITLKHNFEAQQNLTLQIFEAYSNFVECKSFLEPYFPDIFALCETNLDDSILTISL